MALSDKQELTPREVQVLELMFKILTNKQIALGLNISLHTVKAHVMDINRKFGSKNRLEAVLIGIKKGYLKL